MATFNGVGTKFHGFTHRAGDGSCHVTLWLVLLYFPIVPLRAYKIKTSVVNNELQCNIIERLPMNAKEILTTYFFGWVVTPVLWFWPIPFAVRETGEYFGYTNENAEGVFYHCVIGFAILWIAVFAWLWSKWDDKRWTR